MWLDWAFAIFRQVVKLHTTSLLVGGGGSGESEFGCRRKCVPYRLQKLDIDLTHSLLVGRYGSAYRDSTSIYGGMAPEQLCEVYTRCCLLLPSKCVVENVTFTLGCTSGCWSGGLPSLDRYLVVVAALLLNKLSLCSTLHPF